MHCSRSKIPNKKSRPYIYVNFLALLGAPYICDISRLRVNEALLLYHIIFILTCISHMNFTITDGEFVVFTNVRVLAHHIDVSYSFSSLYFIMESHGLCSTLVQGISSIERAMLDD
jgi:hypothetical protein